jgi:hypothetical protein
LACIISFSPLPLGHLRPSDTCSNPVSDPNQITDHLTIIRCTFAHTFKFRNKLFRDHSLTYPSSSWPVLTTYTLVGAFWSMPPNYVTMFWTLVKTISVLSILPKFLRILLSTLTISSLYNATFPYYHLQVLLLHDIIIWPSKIISIRISPCCISFLIN